MATESQIRANRMNAQKSTGPRSKEGKEVVSQNATKHGLCSCRNVIKSESQDEYNQFHDEMIEDLSPVGAMELMLAERIANLSWRLKRAEVFQNAVIESISDDILDLSYNSYIRARNQADEGDLSLVLGIAIRRDFEGSKILEHLLIYEKRIEASLYRATAELRKLQKIRREQESIDEGRCRKDEGRETIDDLNESGFIPGKLRRDKHPTSSFGLRRTGSQSSPLGTTEDKFEKGDSIENNEDCRDYFAEATKSRNDRENEKTKPIQIRLKTTEARAKR